MEHRPIPAITVKSLQGLAVYKLARMLLTSAIPLSLEKYVPFLSRYDHVDVKETDASLMPIGCGTVFQRKRLEGRSDSLVQWNTLDDIILAEAGQCHDHLLPAKEILIEHLVKVKQWWDNEEWLGKQDNKTRRMIRDVCTDMLELFNSSCTCPIFQLTLELIFSKKAGTGQMLKSVSSERCATLSKFFQKLQPFGIEKLITTHLMLDCPSVIVSICENSPLMKYLHLNIEYAKGDILRKIGLITPSLETVIVVVKEYELNEKVLPTLEMIIIGGEGLEDNLYSGFFNGLTKSEVVQKIQEGGSCELSFPNLKYIDVGSHRDVREFLLHLLYFYPNIRSVTCDSENWILSKYSLDFPVMTQATLDYKPVSLWGKTMIYQLKDMSFSSFCLAAVKVQDIVSRYQSLEHISLHLIKGSRKIEFTNETAKELICGINCRCLTICVEVYMDRADLLSLYTPALNAMGPSLRILQLHLTNEVNVGALCQMINMCPHLEELALMTSCERCEVEGENFTEIRCCKLGDLKCLSFSSRYNVTNAMYSLMERTIFAAPNLTSLELELGGNRVSGWLMNIASAGALSNLKLLRINFPKIYFDYQVLSSFLFSLISTLPRLSCLMLGSVCDCVVRRIRKKYEYSQLRIIGRESPYIAFRCLTSRYC
ncbi:uncharacterized protein [Penaeus vannamei]|uniref:uncharacterized protein n=1 Tax=Penaeus vannamei TaxID=6689 RepID=UPI000F6807DC|nr:uncharacterized protein LOC113813161 [Penaeus vannamei]